MLGNKHPTTPSAQILTLEAMETIVSLQNRLKRTQGIGSRTKSLCLRTRFLISAICLTMSLAATTASAQTFTKKIQQPHTNGGKLTIIQKENVDSIIDNVPQAKTPKAPVDTKQTEPDAKDTIVVKKAQGDEAAAAEQKTAKAYIDVYRIQIYTGGNSRQSKARAEQIMQQCKNAFPELNVYVRFVTPHWVTRVGNFRTKQAANRYAQQIKGKGISYEARVLSSKIYKK